MGRPRKKQPTPKPAEPQDTRLPVPNVRYKVTDKHGKTWIVKMELGQLYEKAIQKRGHCGGLVKVEKLVG